jgi:hypothetical protein
MPLSGLTAVAWFAGRKRAATVFTSLALGVFW